MFIQTQISYNYWGLVEARSILGKGRNFYYTPPQKRQSTEKLYITTLHKNSVSPPVFHGGNHKINFIYRETPGYETERKTNRQLAAHGDYSSSDNFRTKLFATFSGIFGIIPWISKYSFIYYMISCRTPKGVLWDPRAPSNTYWDTL